MSTTTTTRTRSDKRNEFLTDVLTTAVEGGIGYWSSVTSYRWSCEPADRHVTIIDDEGDGTEAERTHTVNLDDIARGLRLHRDRGIRCMCGDGALQLMNRTNGEDGDLDSIDADNVVQLAIFGEIVYG